MANISSFSGRLYFKTNKDPWTPEGYLLAYDVLMSIDSSGGDYGICLDETVAENSATFLSDILGQRFEEPVVTYWGNGRWSAANTLDSFNDWTCKKHATQTMTQESYNRTRSKLLDLMEKNEWYFSFEYVDEESGWGYIRQQTADIWITYDSLTMSLNFTTSITTHSDEPYTLKAYCEFVEDSSTIYSCDMFDEVIDALLDVSNIPEDDYDKFKQFIVEKNWHEKLSPYMCFDSYEDIDVELLKEWKEYQNDETKT
jgi:hypothetical protein